MAPAYGTQGLALRSRWAARSATVNGPQQRSARLAPRRRIFLDGEQPGDGLLLVQDGVP
ncbi:MAG: hypothetical protein IT190_08505 [Microbacteriaceae bacterium]|nr:hypothetical protein [Microbacteriaceae bacterium]